MNSEQDILHNEAIALLKRLIATPSFSKEEDNSSTLIRRFLEDQGVRTSQHLYNIWARNKNSYNFV